VPPDLDSGFDRNTVISFERGLRTIFGSAATHSAMSWRISTVFSLAVVIEQHAVLQHVGREMLNILDETWRSPGAGLRAHGRPGSVIGPPGGWPPSGRIFRTVSRRQNRFRGAWLSTSRTAYRESGRPRRPCRAPCAPEDPLRVEQLLRVGRSLEDRAADDVVELVAVQEGDVNLEQEAIELSLRQRVRPLLLDGVLRGPSQRRVA